MNEVKRNDLALSDHKPSERGSDVVLPVIRSCRPKRIQRKRTKGWKMPPHTVYVGRPTIFGNPFFVTDKYTPESCVKRFEKWITMESPMILRTAQKLLTGKNLACWCPLNQPCHADVLLKLVNKGGNFV